MNEVLTVGSLPALTPMGVLFPFKKYSLLTEYYGVFLNRQVHEGEECAKFPLECPQKCGLNEIPREKVQKLEEQAQINLNDSKHEPITRSVQLPHIRVTAFLQTYLFLD